ncbi:TetR/AcrR family transcriptional regulator [Paenibacillus sp. GCM10023252]|uniref:TetR/AcrR family transcriptional regulator n=1 Tax=Paenibacillus sp. GCM10023252 TaxID=3252649 RepID=UPI00360FD3C4
MSDIHPPSVPSSTHSAATTSDRIKQEALGCFLESGYEGASMSEIARAVGIKTPSIYAHFKSKEQLFMELVHDVLRDEHLQLSASIPLKEGQDAVGQLRAVYDLFTNLNQLTTGQAFLKRTMLVPPRHLKEELQRLFLQYETEYTDYLHTIMHRGPSGQASLSQAEIDWMIAVFFAYTDGLLVEYQLYNEELYEARKELLWEALLETWAAREDG